MRVLNIPSLFRCLLVALAGCALSLAQAAGTPAVTITPAASIVNAGTNFTFTANVTNATPTTYQWQKLAGTTYLDIDGATNSTLNLASVLSTDHGLYTVVVGTADNGSLPAAASASLDVNGLPALETTPVDETIYTGKNATFTAEVYSTTPTTNGWYFNNLPITNAVFTDTVIDAYRSEHTILLTNVPSTNAGSYTFISTNASGITSWSAVLTVQDLPDPALRFGAETIVDGQVRFPVYFTSHGTETNLSFSVSYDPTVFANANFEAVVSMTIVGGGTTIGFSDSGVSQTPIPTSTTPVVTNTFPTPPGDPGRNRSRPLPAAIPVESPVTITSTPGSLGVNIGMAPGFTLDPGESTDTLGRVTFTLQPGANPYAGLVTFTNAPLPLAFSPVVVSTNATNSVITTNAVITISQAPPVLVSSNFVSSATGPKLNLQTGNFEQVVQFANPGATSIENVFLVVGQLGTDSNTNAIRHQNAQGYLVTGESFVSLPTLAPGDTESAILEYFAPDHLTVHAPTLTAYSATAITNTLANTTPINITATRFVTNTLFVTNVFLVEFPTKTNYHYYVQYADHAEDFAATNRVRTALPAVLGTGNQVQWLDNGPPKTDSLPTNGARFYHVLETR